MKIILDIETKSDIDINCGVVKYAYHSTTEILCICLLILTEDKKIFRTLTPDKFNDLNQYMQPYTIFIAHNSSFEYHLLKAKGFVIPFKQYRCTQDFAALINLPRKLERICEVLDLKFKKDREGETLMRRVCKTGFKNESEKQRLYEYCKADVLATYCLLLYYLENYKEAENWFSAHPKGFEIELQKETERFNLKGIPIDLKSAEAILNYSGTLESQLKERVHVVSKFEIGTVNQRNVILDWCKKKNFPLKDFKKETVEEAVKQENIPEDVKEILKLRLLLSKTSLQRLSLLKDSEVDGRIYYTFFYRGAITGRWTGVGFQPQNIPRSTLNENDFKIITSAFKDNNSTLLEQLSKHHEKDIFTLATECMRPLVCAKEGMLLFGGDFKCIEPCVLWWLSEDKKAINSLREGDPYIDMASIIYNKPKESITKEERFFGKTTILGCGYQMGAPRFKKSCAENFGVEISEEFASRCVNAYRSDHYKVVQFWGVLQKRFTQATLSNEKYTRFKVEGMETDIIYHNAMFRHGKLVYSKVKGGGFIETETYGGSLAENVTQSLARDIMARSMLLLENAGFPVVMTVHDEIICEAPEDKSLEEFTAIMKQGAGFLKGVKAFDIPVEVESWKGRRYLK